MNVVVDTLTLCKLFIHKVDTFILCHHSAAVKQCIAQKEEYDIVKEQNIQAEEVKLENQQLEATLKLEYIEVSTHVCVVDTGPNNIMLMQAKMLLVQEQAQHKKAEQLLHEVIIIHLLRPLSQYC